ncbi:MAG: TIGR03960 family B12-binding radical SAM protein [Deltaproteobacteria bacterium]|nr:TIGR03960 family B12-binding radical SAM protein [Deltaproteobacteria bacterium]
MSKTNHTHPWVGFLHKVRSPSRYVGGEFGSIAKTPAKDQASLALIFPDVYEVGMSHLGSQILYDVINREPDLRLERCYAPWSDIEAELRARELPLVTLENHLPLTDFDMVGFSLQHELSYTNVLNVLDLSKIPLMAADRDDDVPLVLGGGPCALRPEPMAVFFDAFLVGEAEDALPDLLRLVGRMRRQGASRGDIIQALAQREGVYCPVLYPTRPDPATGMLIPHADSTAPDRVGRLYVRDLNSHPLPLRTVVPWNRAIFDRTSVEISRGCSEGCRFCEAGYTYRPLRDRSPDDVIRTTLANVGNMGYEEVSLGALSPSDHPGLEPMVHALSSALSPKGVTMTVSSLRAYGLSDRVLADLKTVRATGLTMAPEAGSQRLRDVINKNVRDEDLIDAARRAFAAGWQRIKLYFMIGLPTETEDDIVAIAGLCREVLKAGREVSKRVRVTASVGVFVPRPHTPFQWEGMAPIPEIDSRRTLLRNALGKGIHLRFSSGPMSRLECAMARGDRRMGEVIHNAFLKGCRFDNWDDAVRFDLWDEAFEQAGVDREALLGPLPVDAKLPWEVVDPLVSRKFLLRERERAFAGRPLAPCEKPSTPGRRPNSEDFAKADKVICYRCGVPCDSRELAHDRAQTVRRAQALGQAVEEAMPQEMPAAAEAIWHLVFTKDRQAAWLSQKDLVKHLPRILRRAGLVPALSGGYHPQPRITYRPPLPVGYRSAGEWITAVLDVGSGDAPAIDALNRATVQGMIFLDASISRVRRPRPGLTRYAFMSSIEPDGLARKLPKALRVEALSSDETLALSMLGRANDQIPCVLDWPEQGRPAGRPHDILSEAMGVDMAPNRFVRLYDHPDLR